MDRKEANRYSIGMMKKVNCSLILTIDAEYGIIGAS